MNKNNSKINSETNQNNMDIFSLNTILKSGSNFGLRKNLWNAKMKPFIYDVKKVEYYRKTNDKHFQEIHILNIKLIKEQLLKAYNFLYELAKDDKAILFVDTREYLSEIIQEQAERAKCFYIVTQWKGGTLTNLKTIRSRIKKMQQIEKQEITGELEKYPKNEQLKIRKEYYKLKNVFQGIRKMNDVPACLVIFNTNENTTAIKEANKLNIPIVAICNTNSNLKGINYIIPGNNIGKKSILFFSTILADAIVTGKNLGEAKFAFKDNIEELETIKHSINENRNTSNSALNTTEK